MLEGKMVMIKDLNLMNGNPRKIKKSEMEKLKSSIAKEKGRVYFSDIESYLTMYKEFMWYKASNFNTTSVKERAKRGNQTMYDYIRDIWNTPNSGRSPYKYFEGILKPVGLDKDKNIIYEYNYEKAKM